MSSCGRFIFHAAGYRLPPTDLLRSNPRKLLLTESKSAVAMVTLLKHPNPLTTLGLGVNTSNNAIKVILQQLVSDTREPLDLSSLSLGSAEPRYLFLVRNRWQHSVIEHFCRAAEKRCFDLFTNHKAPTYAFHNKSDRFCPRVARHMDYIFKLMVCLRHIKGWWNCVVCAFLSQQVNVNVPFVLHLPAMALAPHMISLTFVRLIRHCSNVLRYNRLRVLMRCSAIYLIIYFKQYYFLLIDVSRSTHYVGYRIQVSQSACDWSLHYTCGLSWKRTSICALNGIHTISDLKCAGI